MALAFMTGYGSIVSFSQQHEIRMNQLFVVAGNALWWRERNDEVDRSPSADLKKTASPFFKRPAHVSRQTMVNAELRKSNFHRLLSSL
jgi:hypothetical protein